ncbi:mushroom body large-type Kenyon cell-specific protein 1 [Biomphalaria pfeifferi]|uniref:Mushroom body large-type Kenyon cell-specific protein 1 n=1 Tax=Biomphalaria pfeifferi TaxID=112525 RepID=A0AAD8ATE2_BIOPF|nr:mushroom body large-type Kenyon cell-specific protein 1 [Biomphalaria pfeifferi]
MVDCGSPRCAQERRSLRRDLQCWSKKLPVVLGLERIAADYVDKETAQKLLDPFPEWEKEIKQDFQPSQRCFHCEKKLPNIYKRIKRIIEDAKKGKENGGKICLRSLQDLMPFCLDFYTRGFGRELFSDLVKSHFLTIVPQVDVKEEPEPLESPPASTDLARLRIPHLASGRSYKKQESNRQNYTEEDIDLAVSDIRSGKLGTRRAAMIYGIPRSTLRSKMVKPERDSAAPEDYAEGLKDISELELYQSAQPCPLAGLKMSDMGMFGMCESVMSFFPPMPFPVCLKHTVSDLVAEQRLSQIRRMHNLNGFTENHPRPAHSNQLRLPLLVNIVRKLVQQKMMEIKENFSRKSYETKSQQTPDSDIFNSFGPYLPAFSPFLNTGHNDENLTGPMYKHIMESIYSNMMNEDNPLPKPFGKVNESSRIGDTLKDIIAKTLSEKIKFRDGSSDESSLHSNPDTYKHFTAKQPERSSLGFTLDLHVAKKEGKVSNGGCSPPKRVKKDCIKSALHPPSSESNSSAGKKTRPKRGQYRKYNSQLLMDAVKAVQRGEMSVHRAGSYFGVPHSTLEYKVKERHLLRQKKSRDLLSPSNCKEEVMTSMTSFPNNSNGSPLLDEDSHSMSKIIDGQMSPSVSSVAPTSKSVSPPASSPAPVSALGLPAVNKEAGMAWFQPYMATAPSQLDTVLGIHPNLTLNNSASELLIQLQHKVQAKCSAAFPADTAFDLPCNKDRVFDLSSTSSSTSSDRITLYKQTI